MTDKKTEALKLALEALEIHCPNFSPLVRTRQDDLRDGAITAIREALAEQPAQQQEPVAWYHAEKYKTHFTSIPSEDLIESGYWKPLYTSPPANKPWVGLDNDDLVWIYSNSDNVGQAISNTEAKLKEKNT